MPQRCNVYFFNDYFSNDYFFNDYFCNNCFPTGNTHGHKCPNYYYYYCHYYYKCRDPRVQSIDVL